MDFVMKTAIWLFFVQTVAFVNGQRIRDKMYEPINGASCFRRLNGTHQTGCSSSQSGSVGVLHLIQREEDFNVLLNDLTAPPYAPLIPPHLFTRKNILRLKNEGGKNISVVLLINKTDKMSQFSHELNCPNQYSGILSPNSTETATCDAKQPEKTWNPYGTGLLHEDFPFPIYYVDHPDELDKLINCFETFNNFDFQTHAHRSLCAVEVNTFMSAAVSSEVCMRRTNFVNNLGRTKYCDPLEGRNVYATLFPRNVTAGGASIDEEEQTPRQINANEKFILVSCRMDTTSMFDGVGLGALDSLFGYAALFNIAHMLAKLLPQTNALQDKQLNVIFVVFNGESYDYIGSQRLVYDMENLAFPTRSTQTAPISFENIEFMIDIGTLDDISSLYLHSITEFPQSKSFLDKLQRYAVTYNLHMNFQAKIGIQMPPTSAQSFLRKNRTFPAFVLNSKPSNKYYHSIYDDVRNINFSYSNTTKYDYTLLMENILASKFFQIDSVQMKIRNASSAVAMALYETLTGSAYTSNKLANPILVDEFFYCFLESADCPLFKAASHPNSPTGSYGIPPLRYVSVSSGPQEASGWTYRLLGYILSQKHDEISKENCTHLPMRWFAGYDGKGECRLTTQNYSYALSPAFLIEDYDWKSGQYSTWTESTWSQFSARIFLRPSRIHEVVTLSIGFVILIISFCVVYIISNRSDILFEDAPSSTDTLTEPTAC